MHKYYLRFLISLSAFIIGIAVVSLGRIYLRRQASPRLMQTHEHSNPAPESKITKDIEWQKIVRDKFSFDLPGDMQPLHDYKEQSGDRSYSNGRGLQIIYWYGGGPCIYPVSPSKPPLSEETLEIDGVQAKLGVDTFEGSDARVPYVCFTPAQGGKSKLSMMAFAHDQEAVETARRVYNSVRFRR